MLRRGKDASDVLQEHEAGSYFAKDSSDVVPEPPLVLDASALSRGAERLAGEPGRDKIHLSAPRFAVEGREIVPDRSSIQGLVCHPRHESGRCKGFPLDVTHTSIGVCEGELEPKLKPSSPGT